LFIPKVPLLVRNDKHTMLLSVILFMPVGNQRLKPDLLAGHLLNVLSKEDQPLILQLLCTEYSNLLMKDVLMRSSVWLSTSLWHGKCVVFPCVVSVSLFGCMCTEWLHVMCSTEMCGICTAGC